MKENMIVETYGLTKRYGTLTALSHVNLGIPAGSIFGLVGNNGAGKTTFLRMLTGELVPTEGSFKMLGATEESEINKVRCRTGSIIEGPAFYPGLTAKQNLEYYRIQRGIPGKGVVDEYLKLVGLEDAKDRKFKKLSMGMKQRLGLALALMGEPRLIILDEPINGLDPAGIIEIRNLLLKVNRDRGITVVISSHILSELENIATHFCFLSRGKVVEQVTSEELHLKCRSYLEVKVTDPSRYVGLLEKEMECFSYKIMPDESVRILEWSRRLSDYSALAVQNGIGLLGFTPQEVKLEDYYMELVGQAQEKEGK